MNTTQVKKYEICFYVVVSKLNLYLIIITVKAAHIRLVKLIITYIKKKTFIFQFHLAEAAYLNGQIHANINVTTSEIYSHIPLICNVINEHKECACVTVMWIYAVDCAYHY